MGLSLSGYESFEPGIGLGVLVPTPPVPTITIPMRSSSALDLLDFAGCKLFEPFLGLNGLAPPSFGPNLYHSTALLFGVCVFYFMPLEPSWPGTGPF